MSNGPTRTGGDTYKTSTQRKYINVVFLPEMWCTYSGECRMEDLLFNDHNKTCLLCKWRKELDIPKILDDKIKESES